MNQTIPTPKVRQTVRITSHGGYNWRCPDERRPGYNGWANSPATIGTGPCHVEHVNGRVCTRSRAEAQVDECKPRVVEGRVIRKRDSITGALLVYVKHPDERYAECVKWADVTACEVLA
jgi:hypothetical protein